MIMTHSASLTIKNFKSYKEATLPLAPLTLLIGANASGKSNAVEAFRFLSWVAGGERLSTLKNRVNDSDKVVRGSIRDLAFNDENDFSLTFSDTENASYSGVFTLNDSQLLLVGEDYSEGENSIFFYRDKDFKEILLKYLNKSIVEESHCLQEDIKIEDSNKSKWMFKRISDFVVVANFPEKDLSILSMRDLYAVIWQEFYDATKVRPININKLDKLSDFLTATLFFDFVPYNMRRDSIVDSTLRNDGSNLAGVLFNICQYPLSKSKLLQLIQSLPEQDITDIKFYVDHRDRVEFSLIETFGNTPTERTMDLLSDGTLKVLGIGAALLSVPEGATVVIEEIDNSIHPTRAYDILALLRQYATERKLNLLLSTHNPALMDALPDAALADVVFCYRDPEEGDSKLVRLGDLEDYLGLVAQGSLGDLVTQGVVERFVKDPATPEQRKSQALDWLSQLQKAD